MIEQLTEETVRICNRHMARLLTNLEEIHTPEIIKHAVKSEMVYLRDDLAELTNECR